MTLEIFQVGRISVVILIRTDTTLDHSQEAEKVCRICRQPCVIRLTEFSDPVITLSTIGC